MLGGWNTPLVLTGAIYIRAGGLWSRAAKMPPERDRRRRG